jgi:uncharacterized membrane protein YbhN (UPF0104 family)
MTLYAAAFATRAVRLNLLLAPEDRIPFTRAFSLSGAATFLLQVLPFRGGELASWAAYKSALGTGWARSGAVFVLAKTVDTATLILVGLAGAAALALRLGAPVLGALGAAATLAGGLALLFLPRLGHVLLGALGARFAEGSRWRRICEELVAGLAVSRERPRLYAAAAAAALIFLAAHLLTLHLVFEALGAPASLAALSLASLSSISTAAALPAPAGTFGPHESGFAAALAIEGTPFAAGLIAAAASHLLTTLAAGLVGVPFFLASRKGGSLR